MSSSLAENLKLEIFQTQKEQQLVNNSSTDFEQQQKVAENKTTKSSLAKKNFDNSRSSDSGKSSSCSPILLDCSFDSGIAGVLLDSNEMQLHKRIQQYQCILLALERDREYFFTIRNRLRSIKDMRNQMNFVEFPPVRCNNLIAGISAVIGIIGGVYLITKTTNDVIRKENLIKMILQASLIGGWEKLELWDHTHLALLGLLMLVCILEVILLKMTTSAGLFTRPHHYDPDYDDSGEYEEDIYYEELSNNYDQWARRQMRYRQQQQQHLQEEQERLNMLQQQNQYNYYDYPSDQNNYFLNNYHTNSTETSGLASIARLIINKSGMANNMIPYNSQYVKLTKRDFLQEGSVGEGKITNRKKKQSNENEFFCNVCCAEIDPEDDKTFVKCYICQKYICRSIKCADWLPKTAEWECELCQTSKESLAQTSSWVADQISFHQEKLIHPPRARSEIYIPISECNDSSIHFESVSQIGANSAMITAEQKLKIREYVEEVVAKLLGGNLDTIAVNQLSKSENYLPDPKNDLSSNGISGESVRVRASNNDFTDISETRLRQMIQKIIAETISLPPLSKNHAVSEIALDRRSKASDNRPLANGYYPRHRTEHYFEPTIYQDLLATAVLNKIVDKQLNNNHEITETDTGGGGGDGEDEDVNDNIRLAESDQNFNIEKLSTTSGSSVEPHSDCSYPEAEQILNNNDDKSSELIRNSDRDSVMSDYLASHLIPLPDLNAIATESEEEDYMSVTSSAIGDGTWETNWLFKKKKSGLGSTVTTNSVGMLVPDPKEDVRAQIGDKTADEVSDLSELGSDTDDSLDSLRSKLEPINDRLANKHLIGGQNSKMVLDELIERSSMISNTLQSNQDILDACNEHVIDAPIKTEAINDNVTQQEITLEQNGHNLRGALCSVVLEDQNSNSLAASDDTSESDGCIGFSAIEIIEPTPDTPSVVEILAAMALGPMLAVPSLDQPATLSVSDFNVFTDLKELALAEIKARSLELTPRNLDVIPEETDNVIDCKDMTTLDEIELSENETIINSPELFSSISPQENTESRIFSTYKPETEESSTDKLTNENISHSSTTSTKLIFDSSRTEEIILSDKSERRNETDISNSNKHEISSDLKSIDNDNAEMNTNNDNRSECLQSTVIRKQESSEIQLQDSENSKTEEDTPKEYSKELDKRTPNFENKTEEIPIDEIPIDEKSDTNSKEFIKTNFKEETPKIETEQNINSSEEQSKSLESEVINKQESNSPNVETTVENTDIKEEFTIDYHISKDDAKKLAQFSETRPEQNQTILEEQLSGTPIESKIDSTKSETISTCIENLKTLEDTAFNELSSIRQTEQNVKISEEQSSNNPSEYILRSSNTESLNSCTETSVELKTENNISINSIVLVESISKEQYESNETVLEEQSSKHDILMDNSKGLDEKISAEKPFETQYKEKIPTEINLDSPNNETGSDVTEIKEESETDDNISKETANPLNEIDLNKQASEILSHQNVIFSEEKTYDIAAKSNLDSSNSTAESECTELKIQFNNEDNLSYSQEQSSNMALESKSNSPKCEDPSACTEVISNTECEILSENLKELDETICTEMAETQTEENKTTTESNLDSSNHEIIEIKVETKTDDHTSEETANILKELDTNKQSSESQNEENVISSDGKSCNIAESSSLDSSNLTTQSECTELKSQFYTENDLSYLDEQSSDMTVESKSDSLKGEDPSACTDVASNTESDILSENSKGLDETICTEIAEAQTEEKTTTETNLDSSNNEVTEIKVETITDDNTSKETENILNELDANKQSSESQNEENVISSEEKSCDIAENSSLDSSNITTQSECTELKVQFNIEDDIPNKNSQVSDDKNSQVQLTRESNLKTEIDDSVTNKNSTELDITICEEQCFESQTELNLTNAKEQSLDMPLESSTEVPSACTEVKVEPNTEDDTLMQNSKRLEEHIFSEKQTEEKITTECSLNPSNHETGPEVIETFETQNEENTIFSEEKSHDIALKSISDSSSKVQFTCTEFKVECGAEESSEAQTEKMITTESNLEVTELKEESEANDSILNENFNKKSSEIQSEHNLISSEEKSSEKSEYTELKNQFNEKSEAPDDRNSQELLYTESNSKTEICDSATTVLQSSDIPLESKSDAPNIKDLSTCTDNLKGLDEKAQMEEKITNESNLDSSSHEAGSEVTEIKVDYETYDNISNKYSIPLNEIDLKVNFSEAQTESNLTSLEKKPSDIPLERNSDSPNDKSESAKNISNENSNVSNKTISQEQSPETHTEQNERILEEKLSKSNLKTKIDENVKNENLKGLVETISNDNCFETLTEQNIILAEEHSLDIAQKSNIDLPNSEVVSNTVENISNINLNAFDETISKVNSSELHTEENISVKSNLNSPDNNASTDITEINVESETDDNLSNENPKSLNEIISKELCLEKRTEQMVEKSSDIAVESNLGSIIIKASCSQHIVESKADNNISNENLKVLDETISLEQFSETKMEKIEPVLEKELFAECQMQSETNDDNLKEIDNSTISQEQSSETKIDHNETVLEEQLSTESNMQSKTNSNISDEIPCYETDPVESNTKDDISNENFKTDDIVLIEQSTETQSDQNVIPSEEKLSDSVLDNKCDFSNKTESAESKTETISSETISEENSKAHVETHKDLSPNKQIEGNITSLEEQSCEILLESFSESSIVEAESSCTEFKIKANTLNDISNEIYEEIISEEQPSKAKENTTTDIRLESNSDSLNNEVTSEVTEIKVESNIDDCISNESLKPYREINFIQQSSATLIEEKANPQFETVDEHLNEHKTEKNLSNDNLNILEGPISQEQTPDTETNESVLDEHTESNLQSKTEDVILNENVKSLNEIISKEQSHNTQTEPTVKSPEESLFDNSTSDLPSFTPSNNNSKFHEEIVSEEASENKTTDIPLENNTDSTNNKDVSEVTEIKVEYKSDENISNNEIILTEDPFDRPIEHSFEDSKVTNEEQSSEMQADPNETALKVQLSTESNFQSKTEDFLPNKNVKAFDETIFKDQSLQSEPNALSSEEQSTNVISESQTITNIPLESNLDCMVNEVTEVKAFNKIIFEEQNHQTQTTPIALSSEEQSSDIPLKSNSDLPNIKSSLNENSEEIISEERFSEACANITIDISLENNLDSKNNEDASEVTEINLESKPDNNITNENVKQLNAIAVLTEQPLETLTEQMREKAPVIVPMCSELIVDSKSENNASNENLKDLDETVSQEQFSSKENLPEDININVQSKTDEENLKELNETISLEQSSETLIEETETILNEQLSTESNIQSKTEDNISNEDIKIQSKTDHEKLREFNETISHEQSSETLAEKTKTILIEPLSTESNIQSKTEDNISNKDVQLQSKTDNENLRELNQTISYEQSSETLTEETEIILNEQLTTESNIQSKTEDNISNEDIKIQSKTDDENLRELNKTIFHEQSSETLTEETETILNEQLSTESNIQSKTEDIVSTENLKILNETIFEDQIPKTQTEQCATSTEDRLRDMLQESHVYLPNDEVPFSDEKALNESISSKTENDLDSTNNELAENIIRSNSDENVSNENGKPLNEMILTEQCQETLISPNVISLEETPSDIALENNSDSTKREEVLECTEPIVVLKAENNISDENSNILDDTTSQQQYSETKTQQNNSVSEVFDEIICKEQTTDTQTLTSAIFLEEQSSDIPLESNTDSLNSDAAPVCTELNVESITSSETLKCLDEKISESKYSEANGNLKVPIETISQEQSFESKNEHDRTVTEEQLSADPNVLKSNLNSVTNESATSCKESVEEKSPDISMNINSESSNIEAVSESIVCSKSEYNLLNATLKVIDEQSFETRSENETVLEKLLPAKSNLNANIKDKVSHDNSKAIDEKISREVTSETQTENTVTFSSEQSSDTLETNSDLLNTETVSECTEYEFESKTKNNKADENLKILIEKTFQESSSETQTKQIKTVAEVQLSTEYNLQLKTDNQCSKEEAEQNEIPSQEHISDIQMHCISKLTNSDTPSACSESITKVLNEINCDLELGLNEKNSAEQSSKIIVDINVDSTKSDELIVPSKFNVQIKTEDNLTNISNDSSTEIDDIICKEQEPKTENKGLTEQISELPHKKSNDIVSKEQILQDDDNLENVECCTIESTAEYPYSNEQLKQSEIVTNDLEPKTKYLELEVLDEIILTKPSAEMPQSYNTPTDQKVLTLETVQTEQLSEKVLDKNSDKSLSVSSETNEQNKIEDNVLNEHLRKLDEIIPKDLTSETRMEENKNEIVFKEESSEILDNSDSTHNKSLCACFESKSKRKIDDELVQENSDQNVLLGCFPRVLCSCLEPNKQSETYNNTSTCKHLISEKIPFEKSACQDSELDDIKAEELPSEMQQKNVALEPSEIPLEVISNSTDINLISQGLETCVVPTIEDISSANNETLSPNSDAKTENNSTEDPADIQLQNNDQSKDKTSANNDALFPISESKTEDNSAGEHSVIDTETVEKKTCSNNSESITDDISVVEHSFVITENVGNEQSKIEQETSLSEESIVQSESVENTLNEHSKASDKLNSTEESVEIKSAKIISPTNEQTAEVAPNTKNILKVVDESPVLPILPVTSEASNTTQAPDVHYKPAELTVSLDDSPTISRQITVVKIENEEKVEEASNKAADSILSATNQPPGNHNITKRLQRQCRVVDTTPSFEDVSPQSLPQTTPPSTTNTLAGLCQKFIHDKHLLNALENRRRRTLLMHRFLSTLDLSISTDDCMEEASNVHTEVLVTENPVVCESFILSHDHDSDYEDCSDSFIFEINDLDKISYNFINNILFSDQLSHDSKPSADSRTNTIEEYIDNENDEKDILAFNIINNSTTNPTTTIITTTTTIPTNSSTEISSKANTTNPNPNNKTNNHKQPITNISDDPTTTTTNQKHPYELLTSAVQNKETSNSNSQCVQQFIKNDQVNLEILTDDNGHNGIHVGVDDGANRDEEDDDVAILRHFVPGSIAEREYKKWYNAVEMPNNPYAPEALKRRISGSQERFIDLPNISPTNDLNTLELLNNQKLDEDENTTRESDYKRYSRDYYINSSLTTPQTSPARDVSARETKDIREVNNNYNNINNNINSYQNKSRNANTKHFPNDCHWTLSIPVRRSSSLKYLNKNINSPPPPYQHAPTYHQHNKTSSILQTRPSTSTSYYNHFNNLSNDDNEDEDDNLDLHSQRSWKSSSALNSKRRTVSMLSLFSADSSRSSNMSRNNHKDSNVLTQFEKQLLHKDLKRNSFRAVSATTKDFVLNPLYEKDQFFNGDKTLKLSIPAKKTLSSKETETELDLYKAIPAQVVENNSSSTDSMPLLSAEIETNTTTTSDDSDTIKIYDFQTQQETKTTIKESAVADREQATVDDVNSKERPCSLAFSRSESGGNIITPTRGATPQAFKFLQPKRKLLEPSQVLSVEEDESPVVTSPSEKPVIEADVAKALPSVKALAKAFLMTTNTKQPEKLWLRKARTLSQGGKKRSCSPKRSLDHIMRTEQLKPEDDLTITSDLSSLETDSSSVGLEIATSSDLTSSAISSTNDPSLSANTSNISPVPVRQGVLKNNIAFFENLKNK
ncbi:hypothetical protein FF38_12233 [Lucilia cuprina]|uniref:PHD-type domain-containing protein n=1 Tax=Lucilia cuprina TaxID=7375 RepID=A0A0L0C3Q4_LUCCU|nr:hypothetical protein FF38_12233 [Lucilia cuprina]